jgi:hypothetical protein
VRLVAKPLSPIDLTAIADADDQNPHGIILDMSDHPVVADTILPEIAQFRAFERFADGARVVETATRSWRKLRMRRAASWPSFASSRSAAR